MTSSNQNTFIITDHARERMKERLHVSDRKIHRLVEKAWKSQVKTSKKIKLAMYTNKHHDKKRIFREMLGYVFVFQQTKKEILLITVY